MFLTALVISVSAYWYDINYHHVASGLGWGREALGFLGFVTWRYYLFFYLGTIVKRYFDRFLRLTDDYRVMALMVAAFVVIAVSPRYAQFSLGYLCFAVSGICGMVMVFTFFRKFSSWFTKERFWGRGLQYVGTRTLDIYLLHFFFLPESMLLYNRQLLAYDNKLLEVGVVTGEAFVVLGCCLFASYVLRLSPFVAKWLFGVRDK
jgi:membrane-bound acyltransferase YfiQ involved in biofilm formation